jgi:hypothetical protein
VKEQTESVCSKLLLSMHGRKKLNLQLFKRATMPSELSISLDKALNYAKITGRNNVLTIIK